MSIRALAVGALLMAVACAGRADAACLGPHGRQVSGVHVPGGAGRAAAGRGRGANRPRLAVSAERRYEERRPRLRGRAEAQPAALPGACRRGLRRAGSRRSRPRADVLRRRPSRRTRLRSRARWQGTDAARHEAGRRRARRVRGGARRRRLAHRRSPARRGAAIPDGRAGHRCGAIGRVRRAPGSGTAPPTTAPSSCLPTARSCIGSWPSSSAGKATPTAPWSISRAPSSSIRPTPWR